MFRLLPGRKFKMERNFIDLTAFTIYITVPLVEYYNNNHYYISVVSFSKIYLITLNETLKKPPEHYQLLRTFALLSLMNGLDYLTIVVVFMKRNLSNGSVDWSRTSRRNYRYKPVILTNYLKLLRRNFNFEKVCFMMQWLKLI